MRNSYSEIMALKPLCDDLTDEQVFDNLETVELNLDLTSSYGIENPGVYSTCHNTYFQDLGNECISHLLDYDDNNIIRVIDYVSRIRYRIAEKCGSKDYQDFGKSRMEHLNVSDDYISLSTPLTSPNRNELLWEYISYIQRYFEGSSQIIKSPSQTIYYFNNKTIDLEIRSELTIPDSTTSLSIYIESLEDRKLNTKPTYSDSFDFMNFESGRKFYFDMLQDLYNDALSGNIDSIAELHWYLSRYTPVVRGGGTLAEWISISLLLKNYDFKRWNPEIEAWAMAVIFPKEEFINNYTRLFLVEGQDVKT